MTAVRKAKKWYEDYGIKCQIEKDNAGERLWVEVQGVAVEVSEGEIEYRSVLWDKVKHKY